MDLDLSPVALAGRRPCIFRETVCNPNISILVDFVTFVISDIPLSLATHSGSPRWLFVRPFTRRPLVGDDIANGDRNFTEARFTFASEETVVTLATDEGLGSFRNLSSSDS
jgi:hypothetical protein